jgi:hypothetical protein
MEVEQKMRWGKRVQSPSAKQVGPGGGVTATLQPRTSRQLALRKTPRTVDPVYGLAGFHVFSVLTGHPYCPGPVHTLTISSQKAISLTVPSSFMPMFPRLSGCTNKQF